MTNINREVWNLISSDIAIQKAIKMEIINNRALAKYLIKKYNLNFTLDAVLSAVRRYNIEEFSSMTEEIEESFKDMALLTKSNIASIELKDKAFVNIANDFLTKQLLKENFRMIKTKETIIIMVNQKELEKKLDVFPHEDIIRVRKDLCEIRIVLAKDVTYKKGFLSRISGELALYGVNIHDIIVGIQEVLIYVEEKDLVEAQKCLMELRKKG